MKKYILVISIGLNLVLGFFLLHYSSLSSNQLHMIKDYKKDYLPASMYENMRDKVCDYEWILKNIYKCESPSLTRYTFCKR